MIRKSVLTLMVAGFLILSAEAHAITFTFAPSGELAGAQGIDVGGTQYDVLFGDRSCASHFSLCDEQSDFTFGDSTSASFASSALLDQVLIDSPAGSFDSQPGQVLGCGHAPVPLFAPFCRIYTPHTVLSGGEVQAGFAHNRPSISSDFIVINTNLGRFDRFERSNPQDRDRTWAIWSLSPPAPGPSPVPTPAPVPEPATFVLLGTGLAGLIFFHRRKKNQSVRHRTDSLPSVIHGCRGKEIVS